MPRLVSLLIAVVILLLGIATCLPLLREKAVQKKVALQLEEDLRAEQEFHRQATSRIRRFRRSSQRHMAPGCSTC